MFYTVGGTYALSITRLELSIIEHLVKRVFGWIEAKHLGKAGSCSTSVRPCEDRDSNGPIQAAREWTNRKQCCWHDASRKTPTKYRMPIGCGCVSASGMLVLLWLGASAAAAHHNVNANSNDYWRDFGS